MSASLSRHHAPGSPIFLAAQIIFLNYAQARADPSDICAFNKTYYDSILKTAYIAILISIILYFVSFVLKNEQNKLYILSTFSCYTNLMYATMHQDV